jgi:hypothetical protein
VLPPRALAAVEIASADDFGDRPLAYQNAVMVRIGIIVAQIKARWTARFGPNGVNLAIQAYQRFPTLDGLLRQSPAHWYSVLQEHDAGPEGQQSPSQAPAVEYTGISGTGWTPPDDNLAVSPTTVIEAVNESLGFWDQSGNPITSNGSNILRFTTLFSGVGGSLGVFDPRIVYDPANGGHFILVGLEQGTNPQVSNLDIAISTTNSPLPTASDWYLYRVNTVTSSGGTNYWLDFPGLGFDSQAIYVTGNLFSFGSNNFLGAKLMTFDKNALETTGTPGGTPSPLSPANSQVITDGGSIQPAVTLDPTAPAEYMIEDWDTNDVRIHAVTNPLNGSFSRTTDIVPVPYHGLNVPGAVQEGSTHLIATNDSRIINAVYRNGSLFAAHTVQNGSLATAVWYQIAPNGWPNFGTPALTNSGSIEPSPSTFTFFPSIAVDANGDLALSYAESSSSMYASAYYTVIPTSGPSTSGVIQSGQAVYTGNRWGDFSGMAADPTTPGVFWGVGEYTQSSGAWGTAWTQVVVNPTQVTQLAISGPTPNAATAGSSFNITVTAENAAGQPVPSYTGTVHFTSTDAKASLPPNYTFTSSDNGSHTFSVTLFTAGSQAVTVADTSNPSLMNTLSGIAVSPAAASTFLVTGYPKTTTAGATHSFTVTARDPYGNVATGYTGTVHFTSTDAKAVLPADYTFTTANAGTQTFSATLVTAGTRTLTATDTANSTITGSETGIKVNPGPVAALSLTGFPSTTTAGVSHGFTVKAKDAYGNVVPTYTGTVHFTSTDMKAILPADYTFTTANKGVASFTGTLATSGTQSIIATDTSNASITGKETSKVVAAAASQLVVVGYPSPTTVGTPGNFTVTAEDPFGNVATSYLGTVTFSSTDPAALLPNNYTFTAKNGGKHTFSATFETQGTWSLTATDTSNSSITGSQTGIVVN